MAEDKPTTPKDTVKVDPAKVIITQPVAVKESFNKQIIDITSKKKII